LGNTLDAYTLANNDIVNSVYICHRKVFNVTDSDVVQIPALGAAPLATRESTYARTSQASPVQCLLIPGTGGWVAAPSQIQASINALGLAKDTSVNAPSYGPSTAANQGTINGSIVAQTTGATIATDITNSPGVGLLTKSTVLHNSGSQVLAAGATYSSGQLTITKPTYEIYVTAQGASSTEARPWISIKLTWVDNTSGATVETQQYSVAQAFTSGNQYHGVGPIHADRVTVQIINHGTTQNCTITLLVLNNALAQTELWRSETMITNAPNGFGGIAQAYSLPNNILFMHDAAALGAGGTDGGRGVAFYCGNQMELRGNTTSNTTDMEVLLRIPASLMAALGLPATANENVLFDYNSDSKGLIQQTLFLPRVQVEVVMINHNAAAKDCMVTIMGAF
jgi:hypothetical protein